MDPDEQTTGTHDSQSLDVLSLLAVSCLQR